MTKYRLNLNISALYPTKAKRTETINKIKAIVTEIKEGNTIKAIATGCDHEELKNTSGTKAVWQDDNETIETFKID